MSYHQKYLKYKQKYLDLKHRLGTEQVGGAKLNSRSKVNNLDIDDISELTTTPSETMVYGYELVGGDFKNVDEIVTTTTIEDMVGGDGNHDDVESSLLDGSLLEPLSDSQSGGSSNSSIETSSIENLSKISSIENVSTVDQNNSVITTTQEGGHAKDSSSESSISSLSDLDSDTSESESD